MDVDGWQIDPLRRFLTVSVTVMYHLLLPCCEFGQDGKKNIKRYKKKDPKNSIISQRSELAKSTGKATDQTEKR